VEPTAGGGKVVAGFIYHGSLFTFLVKGMTAFSALQRNHCHTLKTVFNEGRKLGDSFPLNR
jgi:hypothetical protein